MKQRTLRTYCLMLTLAVLALVYGAAQAGPVGDYNRDGVDSNKDVVSWIRSFGIQFRTYADKCKHLDDT